MPDPSSDDAESLLRLAARLDAAGRSRVAEAARQAATGPPHERDPHTLALRRRAIEVAVRLDTGGLPDDAQTVFDEVVRRATGHPDAMPDRPFAAWLDAVVEQLLITRGR